MISGCSDFEYAKTAIRYGVEDYLLKPIDKGELSSALSKIVESRQHGGTPKLSALQPDSLAEGFLRGAPSAVTENRLCRLFHAQTLYPAFLAALVKIDGQDVKKKFRHPVHFTKGTLYHHQNRLRQLPESYYDLYILDWRCCIILNLELGSYELLKKLLQRAVIAIRSLPELTGASSVTASCRCDRRDYPANGRLLPLCHFVPGPFRHSG